MMNRGTTGVFNTQAVAGETWRTFIPNPLPPVPPIAWDAALQNLLQNAALALGKLESLTQFLPNPHLFLYSYVRKEALLSSQIEGTQSTFDDIIKFEAEGSSGCSPTTSSKSRVMLPRWSTGCVDSPKAFRFHFDYCARFTVFCSAKDVDIKSNPESSALRKTGLAVRVPEMPPMCRRQLNK